MSRQAQLLAALGVVLAVVIGSVLFVGGLEGPAANSTGDGPAGVGPRVEAEAAPRVGPLEVARSGREASAVVCTGRVVDAAGVPVEGAAVAAGTARVASSRAGEFRLELEAAAATLRVTKDGYLSLERQLAPVAGELRLGDLVLLAEDSVLRGRVVDMGGAPRAGVAVHFGASEELEDAALESCLTRVFRGPSLASFVEGTLVSDEAGAFVLPLADLRASDGGLTFWAQATGELGEARLERPSPSSFVTLTLAPVRSVSGTVVDERGAALAGLRVSAVPFDRDLTRAPAFSAEWARGTTASDGSFELLGVQPGPLSVGVERPDGSLEVFRLQALERRDVRLVLQSVRDLSGKLVDERTGRPVAGGDIGLIVTHPDGRATVHAETRSTAEGAFVLEGVPSIGSAHLIVRHPDFAPTGTRMSGSTLGRIGEVAVADLPAPLEVQLERGTTLGLQLLLFGGGAAPGVDVTLSGHGGLVRARGTSDAAGRVVFEHLVPGHYRLDVRDEHAALTPESSGVDVGPEDSERSVHLTRAARLSGRLVDRHGEPVAGAVVDVSLRGEGQAFAAAERVARSRADGRFEVSGIAAGSHFTLEALGPGGLTGSLVGAVLASEVELELGDVVLAEVASLTGRVTDPQGLGIAEAELHLVRADRGAAPQAVALTDGDGRFSIQGVDPGSMAVIARKSGHYATRLVRVDVVPGSTHDDVQLELAPGTSIEGTVTNPMYAGLAGVSVVATWSPVFESEDVVGPTLLSKLMSFNRATTLTDGQGQFAFDDVPPDQPLTFSAFADGRTSAAVYFSPFFVDVDRHIRLVLGKASQ